MYKTRLIRIKGSRVVRAKEMPLSASSLNTNDAFILDAGLKVKKGKEKTQSWLTANRDTNIMRYSLASISGAALCLEWASGESRRESKGSGVAIKD